MKFSIIVPMYNSSDWMEQCIHSIKNQTYKNFDCFLIDDGSTDNTAISCQNMIKDDTRFKLICKPNGGVSSARNKGLEQAEGDYIIFVDSDDCIEENLLDEINRISKGEIVQYNFFL